MLLALLPIVGRTRFVVNLLVSLRVGEVTLFSLLVGSLGMQTVIAGGWLRWHQIRWHQISVQQQCEEEEILTPYDVKDAVKWTATSKVNREDVQTVGLGDATKRTSDGATLLLMPQDPRLVGWEFKIVRANRDVSRDPVVLERLCDEESLSGWILLEKFDDRRVRFKRPLALREMIKPDMVPVDPYRTQYGSSRNWTISILAIASLLVLLLPAYLGYALVASTLNRSSHLLESPGQAAFGAPKRMQPERGES